VIAALQEHEHLPVVIDLAGVGMLPSVSIGALIQVSQVAKGNGQRFLLTGLSPNVRDTLRICRLDRVFEICDSREAAIAALRP
jgi:anti-sigma B factor antagonist